MKRVLVLADAAADFPYPELQDRTPLTCARMPAASALAEEGQVGSLRIRSTAPDGSRAFLAEALGFSAREAARLRWGPLGVLAHGGSWEPGRVAYLAHFIHVDAEGLHYPVSPSSREDQEGLLRDIGQELQDVLPEAQASLLSLSPGRFVITLSSANHWLSASPMMYQQARFLQRLDPLLRSVLEQIRFFLEFHPVNELRLDLGDLPITTAWCWSGGHRIPEPPARTFPGVVLSPDLFIKGLALRCGLPFVELPDPYRSAGEPLPEETLAALLRDHEEILIWLPAPFASERFQEPQEKVRRLDEMDYRLLRPIRKLLQREDPIRLLLAAVGLRHRGRPERGTAPCLLWGSGLAPDPADRWTEAAGWDGRLGSPRWAALLETFRNSS